MAGEIVETVSTEVAEVQPVEVVTKIPHHVRTVNIPEELGGGFQACCTCGWISLFDQTRRHLPEIFADEHVRAMINALDWK